MPELARPVTPNSHTRYDSRLHGAYRHITTTCLVLVLVALWPLIHQYKGLAGDAALYAVQALAKIHPNLAGDFFLQNNSQDNYTVFPLFYAWCIRGLGLRDAALVLFIVLKIWFFSAAWALTHQLFGRRSAFLSTAMVIAIAGSYGGYRVFNYSEDWLTARTLAEPMVITAFWLYFRGMTFGAFLVAFAAFLVHPLMTLPGLLLLGLLWLPLAVGTAGALLGVGATLAAALIALHHPLALRMLSIMDADWLEVVRERSVFLFPQLWPATDWEINALPFISLAISARILSDSKIQKLLIAVALVGITGIVAALIAATVGPVGLFLQGQTWRWVWITRFTAVILLAPTVLTLWKADKGGPVCALLTILGWQLSPTISLVCLTTALFLRSSYQHITDRGTGYLRWAAVALAGVVLAWAITQTWIVVSSWARSTDRGFSFLTTVSHIVGLGLISMGLAWWLLCWAESTASRTLLASLLLALLICCVPIYSGTFRVHAQDADPKEFAEFSDWRRLIAPDETIFVVPAHNSATFAWFALERPSYLTVDQSAGVVFSRATAVEVKRRSQILLPLMDPDWKLLSEKASKLSEEETRGKTDPRVLTRDSLIKICSDPKLNFIVARENLGFDPVTHTDAGRFKDWNLYDCRLVLSAAPPA
jgi:hypothetical protein